MAKLEPITDYEERISSSRISFLENKNNDLEKKNDELKKQIDELIKKSVAGGEIKTPADRESILDLLAEGNASMNLFTSEQMKWMESQRQILEDKQNLINEKRIKENKLDDEILLKSRQTKYLLEDTDMYSGYIKTLKYLLVFLFVLAILIYVYRVRKVV